MIKSPIYSKLSSNDISRTLPDKFKSFPILMCIKLFSNDISPLLDKFKSCPILRIPKLYGNDFNFWLWFINKPQPILTLPKFSGNDSSSCIL